MKKLLVTGASGFLGWNVCRCARGQWDVTGTCYRHGMTGDSGVAYVRVDLTVADDVARMLETLKPDAVIHAAADADPNHCERHPESSHAINVEAAVRLAAACAAMDISFVFTSTDLVFDGRQPPYAETAAPGPVNRYGRQNVEAEQRIRATHAGAAICRMPLMFGAAGPGAERFLQPLRRALTENRPQPLFVDEFRTPVSGDAAARGLLMALARNVGGVLHLGGRERISRYDFGRLVAEVHGLGAESLIPARQVEVRLAAARPPDVSLDSARAFALGYDPGTLREQLTALP